MPPKIQPERLTPYKRFKLCGTSEERCKSTAIEQWFLDDQQAEFADLKFLIASEFSGKAIAAAAPANLSENEILLGRYRLESQLISWRRAVVDGYA